MFLQGGKGSLEDLVFVEAEGSGELLDNFVEWCRKSPGMSVVKSVVVEKGEPVHYTDFRIEQ